MVVMAVLMPIIAIANPLLDEMDTLTTKGNVDNLKKSIELGLKAVSAEPESYEANWKLARSYAYYLHALQQHLVPGWEEECKVVGKKGMTYAEEAMKLEPDKPEGRYFFAFSAGMYSYGISILGAIKEGLKGKTQNNFEKVYAMDKNYDQGWCAVSLARFWHQLPWPLKNKEKALEYYREFQAMPFYAKDANSRVLFGDLLADMGDKHKKEAKEILDVAMKTCSEYYMAIAKEAMKKL